MFLPKLLRGSSSSVKCLQQGQQQFGQFGQVTVIVRSLHNDNSYNLKRLENSVADAKQSMPDHLSFMESYKREFSQSGIKRILSQDVSKFSRLMSSTDDHRVQTQVILTHLQSKRRNTTKATRDWVLDLSHSLTVFNQLELAHSFFGDPAVASFIAERPKGDLICYHRIPRDYSELLYRNEQYDAVIDLFTKIAEERGLDEMSRMRIKSLQLQALGSLALTKSLTPEQALDKACSFFIDLDDATSFYRVGGLLAWLAFKAGEFGLAADVVSFSLANAPPRQRVVLANLHLLIYAEMGRPEEAVAYLERGLDRHRGTPQYYLEVMRSLARAVSVEEVSDKTGLKDKFAQLCLQLDKQATMIEDSLESQLFQSKGEVEAGGPFSTQAKDEALG